MTSETLQQIRRMAEKKKLTRAERDELTRLTLALQADMYEAVLKLSTHQHPEIPGLSADVRELQKQSRQAGWRDVITAVATALGVAWSRLAG